MKIKIDGQEMNVSDSTMNIVEIADHHGMTIIAPCFRNKKSHGCCKACVIEADGDIKYACGTKPYEGMEIVYDREDLADLRRQRLNTYGDALKTGDVSKNTCGSQDPVKLETRSCCGGSDSTNNTSACCK